MTFFETLICILIAYLCFYTLVNRICNCVEQKELYKAYGKYISTEGEKANRASIENFFKVINKGSEQSKS